MEEKRSLLDRVFQGALETFKGRCQLGSRSVRLEVGGVSGPSPVAETLVYSLRFKAEHLGAWCRDLLLGLMAQQVFLLSGSSLGHV